MKKEIIINATATELRVAINEDDRLAEIFLDVPDKQRHVGSVFLGRVQRIVQGMNAAFIDIGEDQDAFLHFSDAANAMDEYKDAMDDDDDDLIDEEADDALEAAEAAKQAAPTTPQQPSGEQPAAPARINQQPATSRAAAPPSPDRRGQQPQQQRGQQPQQSQSNPQPSSQVPAGGQRQQPQKQAGEVKGGNAQQPPKTTQQPTPQQSRQQPAQRGGSTHQPRQPAGAEPPKQQQGRPQGRPQPASQQQPQATQQPAQQRGGQQQGKPAANPQQQGTPRQAQPSQPGESTGQQQGRPQPGKPQPTQQQQRQQQQTQQQNPQQRKPQPHAQRPQQGTKPGQQPPAAVSAENVEPAELEAKMGIEAMQLEEAMLQETPMQTTAPPEAAPEGKKKKRRRGRRGRGQGKGQGEEPTLGMDAELEGDDGDEEEISSTDATAPQPATPPVATPAGAATEQRRAGRPAKRPTAPAKPVSNAPAQVFATPEKSASEIAPEPATPEAAPAPQKRRATRKTAAATAETPAAVEPAAAAAIPVAAEPPKQKKAAASRKKTTATKGNDDAANSALSSNPQAAPVSEEAAASVPKKSAPAKRATTKRAATKRADSDSPTPGEKGEPGAAVMDAKLPTFQTKRSGEVTIALERGQDILVQVTRESYASKGVRVTTKVTLAGRFLVLLPLEPAIGVSRKIMSVKERRRLRRIARSILPEGHGCIIRTVAQDKDEELIRSDLQKQIETWQTIEQRVKAGQKPGLIYKEQSIAATVMRDLFTPDITRVVIDSKSLHKAIREYVEWAAPALAEKIELYTGESPIFEAYGIERELEKMMFDRKVYLPSGGYIILEQTEAMMVIDVNSGRYAGNKEQELNSLKTNIEAAREIARQIRLRDIGGLLVVDFIDLYEEKNRKKVYDELKNHLRRDRAKSVVLPMTQFGLIQMTRQRVRQQVLQTLSEECPTCTGSGLVPSKSTVARKIERWLFCFKETSREFRLTLAAHPSVISYLTEGSVSRLTQLMLKHFVRIKVIPNDSLPVDQFQFFSVRQQIDITEKYMPKEAAGH